MAATVQYGSKGNDVSQLQTLLNQQGYNLSVDGVFGSATQAAVKQYQQSMGLSVDGIVGTNTWGSLTGGGSGGTGSYYNPSTGQMMPAGWTPENDTGGYSGGYSYSGVTGNPSFTFDDLKGSLNLNTYTPRTDEELLREAQNRYDPIYNQNVLSTQQAYDSILLALDQQAAGLQSSYDKQRESTAENFAQAYSQSDRQALSRGMQRSSYNAQTLSNIGIAGAKAQDDINTAQRQDETNIAQNRALQQQQLAQTLQRLETDYATNIAAYQDQLRNLDYDRAWQSQQAANEAMMNLYQLSLQQYQFERQLAENARQFDASLAASQAASSSGSGGGGSSGTASTKSGTTSSGNASVTDFLNSLSGSSGANWFTSGAGVPDAASGTSFKGTITTAKPKAVSGKGSGVTTQAY